MRDRKTRATSGLPLVLVSSLAFGTSGPVAKSLLEAGWSPGAAVLVRITGAAVVMAVLTLVLWRPHLRQALQARRTVLFYGVVAVAGVQVCYFTAVRTLSVGVALLLEYLAPVLVVAWLWLRTGRRPQARTLTGGALALLGTVGVLDVFGGVQVDLAGVLWALGAAACLACYFLVLGGEDGDGKAATPRSPSVHPGVLASAGMVVGSLVVASAGFSGVLPVTVGDTTSVLVGTSTPVWVPVLALVLGSTVLAYLTGAAGLARMSPTAGSLVSLSEVLFAVLAAWVLLGEWPTPVQLGGGLLVVAGVVLAQTGRAGDRPAPVPVPAEAAVDPSRAGMPVAVQR